MRKICSLTNINHQSVSGSAPNSELVLKWESPNPIGENDFSQPENTVLKIQTCEAITVYKEPGSEAPAKNELGNLPRIVGRKISKITTSLDI